MNFDIRRREKESIIILDLNGRLIVGEPSVRVREAINQEMRALDNVFDDVRQKASDLLARMRERLEEQQSVFELPEIEFEADEDPDPLFDSRRGYLDQLARYKRFQGKAPGG